MNGQRQTTALIVDDEEIACLNMARYLGSLSYKTRITHSGEEALEAVNNDPPDIVLLDIKMPGIDGIETLRLMRAINDELIIIMLTAVDDLDSAINAIKERADGFLRKPIVFKELTHIMESALEKRRLIRENRSYQRDLEEKVSFQTAELKKMNLFLRKANLEIVRALSAAIDASDPYTRGHSDRVTGLALAMGRELELNSEMMEALEYGALLHDIGKIGIKEYIIAKPGKLTDEEFEEIKRHPVVGDTIVSNVEFLKKTRPVVRNHHERFDGTGYPDGLKSTHIDILARIVSVADAYDAITSDRPYRSAMSAERAGAILRENKGKQFDPDIVDVFLGKRLYLF